MKPNHYNPIPQLLSTLLSLHLTITSLAAPLDAIVCENALKALSSSPRTGVLHPVALPQDLRGQLEASVVRLRTGSVYFHGANYANFSLPPHTTVIPYAERIAVVYVKLQKYPHGQFALPGYAVATPVVGLLAYDSEAINHTRPLALSAVGQEPIRVRFTGAVSHAALNASAKCVYFARGGARYVSEVRGYATCAGRGDGHFTIAVPMEMDKVKGEGEVEGKGDGGRRMWVLGWCSGVGGVVAVGLGLVWAVKTVRRRRREAMERSAEEAESLGNVWVKGSRVPVAQAMRTRPAMED